MKEIVCILLAILVAVSLASCAAIPKDENQPFVPSSVENQTGDQSNTEKDVEKNYELPKLIIDITMLIISIIGGGFALLQWYKTTVYKRSDVVKGLIETVRGNSSISTVLEIIDWDEDFSYDGKFTIDKRTQRPLLQKLSDDELFNTILKLKLPKAKEP